MQDSQGLRLYPTHQQLNNLDGTGTLWLWRQAGHAAQWLFQISGRVVLKTNLVPSHLYEPWLESPCGCIYKSMFVGTPNPNTCNRDPQWEYERMDYWISLGRVPHYRKEPLWKFGVCVIPSHIISIIMKQSQLKRWDTNPKWHQSGRVRQAIYLMTLQILMDDATNSCAQLVSPKLLLPARAYRNWQFLMVKMMRN